MVIANLMASVLALAMVGASTASVSKVENDSAGSDVVLNADVHKAYYDPTETYGTTEGRVYVYFNSDYLLYGCSNNGEAYANASVQSGWFGGANQSTWYDADLFTFLDDVGGDNAIYSDEQESNCVLFGILPKDLYLEQKQNDEGDYLEGSLDVSLDVYCDGSLIGTFVPNGDSYGEYVFNWNDIVNHDGNVTSEDHYYWIFDHHEDNSYTPVDMLGDIAEGLTGGIVPVAEGIGSGLQSLVQDIFLNASHDGLSVFGIVIICFAGLALALGLSRWVLNFVDSLGARDR